MKYLPDRSIFFLHIPKCAGKSVQIALSGEQAGYDAFAEDMKLDLNAAEKLFSSEHKFLGATGSSKPALTLSGLGRVDPFHLPLFVLEAHFPTTWELLNRAVFSFAMTRAPRERFLSALMQRMMEFKDIGATRIDDPSVYQEAMDVCDWLAGRNRFADLEYVHFIPQADFVILDGKRIVKNVFPVDRTDVLVACLRKETGLAAHVPKSHARRQPKPWARSVQPVARFAARHLMPNGVKKAIYPYWTGSALFSNASQSYDKVDLGADVEAFIADYYRADFTLYEEAVARASRTATLEPAQ